MQKWRNGASHPSTSSRYHKIRCAIYTRKSHEEGLDLDIVDRRYMINEKEAKIVRRIFKLLLELQSCRKIAEALNAEGIVTKKYQTKTGKDFGGQRFRERIVYDILTDHKYAGRIQHKGVLYPGEHKAIVTDDLFDKVPEDNSRSDDSALVVSLARAWQWQEELEAGEYSTVEELSAAKKIDVSYVRRMLRLNSLAPDIVEAILQNEAPDHLSLRFLYRGIPLSWAEQRKELLSN